MASKWTAADIPADSPVNTFPSVDVFSPRQTRSTR